MKTYKIKAGTRGITFTLNDGKLTPGTCSFTEDQILLEDDVVDTPIHEQLGTTVEIEDARFKIVHEFAKHEFSVFQKWKGDSEDDHNRMVVVVHSGDVKVEY